jgi:EAL domain-containing protein (putative c-di-GMP-specific phosphodiesterase class I)
LHYQPKIDLETGTVIGAEALIRWNHPERGLLFPAEFMSIAEDCGLIVPIGHWVVREASRQARTWMDTGLPAIPVSVNISAVEFRDPHFLDNLRTVLDDTRLDPRFFELELTESSLMQQVNASAITLQALKQIGVQLTIDDFGTGNLSLTYLRQFPIDALKVDRSFIREITDDRAGACVARTVISMGRSLGHRVVAEGVETREQLAYLRAHECGEGQGHYFSRPLENRQFVTLIETRLPVILQ